MSMFTLAISCLTTSNLPWFMDLTFQVPKQYCSLQHQTLLLSPVTSTAGYCFCFGFIPSLFLKLFCHWSPVAYWAPTDLESFSFSILSFCLFILFVGFSRQEYWSGLPFPSPVGHILSDLSTMTHQSWIASRVWLSFIELMLKILQARLQQYVNREIPDVQAGCRKGRGTRDQIANIRWIMEKAREFQKNIYFCFLTMPKPLTVCITINRGKFFKRWEYQTIWPASWETCMQVRKQQLELDMEQQTGSK